MEKEDQDEIKSHLGKDELNLVEVPFTLLSDRTDKEQKTIKFIDNQNGTIRHWTISGSNEYGLPCALDEPVFIAMLALTKRDEFKSQEIYFNQLKMLKLMKWSNSGQSCDRLKLALNRLIGVTIYTNHLWDRGKFVSGEFAFHIIDESFLYHGKKKNHKNSWFKWGSRIFESFIQGNLKNLDLDVYFDLKTPISKRLFRLIDKRLYRTNQIFFDLQDLAHEKLGITRKMIYPSELKRKLQPALDEHIAKCLISSAEYTRTKSGNWMLTIRKYHEPALIAPQVPCANPPAPAPDLGPLPRQIIRELMDLGVTRRVAEGLASNADPHVIADQIAALPHRKNIENRPAFLVRAIQDNFPLPVEFRRRRAEADAEAEDVRRGQYNKYLLAEVNRHLAGIDPDKVKDEIDEYWPIFFNNLDPDIKDLGEDSSYLRKQCEYCFRIDKAKALNLLSFEDWK